MQAYAARRIALVLPVILGVATLVFLFLHLIPGDPVDMMLGETALAADRDSLRTALGLDRPVLQQYGRFLLSALQGDLGTSVHQRRKVSALILERYPATLVLTLASMIVSLMIALPAGMLSGLRPYSVWDHTTLFASLLAVSMPNFWLGPLLIWVFSIRLGLLPVSGTGGLGHLVLPALTLGASMAAIVARMARSSILENLRQDYVRTARAKGLSEAVVAAKHVLRNALLPVLTVAGLQLGSLLAGSIITETIFSWPGIGSLTVQAIQARDYPVVQGCVLVIALSYVLVNLMTDLAYALVDPRIRYEKLG
ncbi:MAG: nickel ABC transporter permease [bacterium]